MYLSWSPWFDIVCAQILDQLSITQPCQCLSHFQSCTIILVLIAWTIYKSNTTYRSFCGLIRGTNISRAALLPPPLLPSNKMMIGRFWQIFNQKSAHFRNYRWGLESGAGPRSGTANTRRSHNLEWNLGNQEYFLSTHPCNYLRSCWKISDVWKYFLNKSCSQGDKYSAPALYRLQLKFEPRRRRTQWKVDIFLRLRLQWMCGNRGRGAASSKRELWGACYKLFGLWAKPGAQSMLLTQNQEKERRMGERNHFYFPGLANYVSLPLTSNYSFPSFSSFQRIDGYNYISDWTEDPDSLSSSE